MSILEDLEARGFDKSFHDGFYVRLGCSRCEALAINGVACHETGCPNQMHECAECNALVPKVQRLCESCANPEPFEDDEPEGN